MTSFNLIHRFASAGTLGALLLFTACSDSSSSDPVIQDDDDPVTPHVDVALRDVHGDPLSADSTAPYSPRKTCGRCHDVDEIATGYHFQQGRTDSAGRIEQRLLDPWSPRVAVLSPGMFGKW